MSLARNLMPSMLLCAISSGCGDQTPPPQAADSIVGAPPPAASAPPPPAAGAPPPTASSGPRLCLPPPGGGKEGGKNFWPRGSALHVALAGGTPTVRTRVQGFAKQWSNEANVHFSFDDDKNPEIRIGFDPAGRLSWSLVGKDACSAARAGQTTMNFGWLTDTLDDEEFGRVVLHEFGHAMGMVHEHQLPVGVKLEWDPAAVWAYYGKGGTSGNEWNQAKIDSNIINPTKVESTNGKKDPDSIMLYFFDTSLLKQGNEITNRHNTKLSAGDKEFVRSVYGSPGNPTGRGCP